MPADAILDLAIIGGGVNGAGIARDAAGRGLSTALLEAGDLAGATSQWSTKLVHGGLRYLEFHEYRLVAKALAEREVILSMAPHISRPMPFILPHVAGLRPRWMIRAGLFLYDHLARRRQVPGSSALNLAADYAGPAFRAPGHAFLYHDGWIDDARLVVENARDAAARGATVTTYDPVATATRTGFGWVLRSASGRETAARHVVNAAGPWAHHVGATILGLPDTPELRLVQGAHIITRRVNRGPAAWMLQQPDGRIVFVIPYETDFSLIGTTDLPVDAPEGLGPTAGEEEYLLTAVNAVLARPLEPADIVHRFAGVRPLVLEPGVGARETTRDWRLHEHAGGAATTVIGGKITTYRRLAEAVLAQTHPQSRPWTKAEPLPGGRIPREHSETGQAAFARWLPSLQNRQPDYDPAVVRRLALLYGAEAERLLDAGVGARVGPLFEAELEHLRTNEWARTTDDVLWRRTKLGLRATPADRAAVADWLGETVPA